MIQDPSSMHERAAVLARFRKKRRKYLPIKYAYYSHSGAGDNTYDLRIRDVFLTNFGYHGVIIVENVPKGRAALFIKQYAFANGTVHCHSPTSPISFYRWWFADQDAPELLNKVYIS